jgi:hypothetical protein
MKIVDKNCFFNFGLLNAIVQWLRLYSTSRKVSGSRLDEMN